MAAVTICSDFGAQKNKVSHCLHCFPIYLPWSDGTGCGGCNGTGAQHRPRGATPCPRSGAVAERSYPTSKVRSKRLHFAGAAVKRYPTSKVREAQVRLSPKPLQKPFWKPQECQMRETYLKQFPVHARVSSTSAGTRDLLSKINARETFSQERMDMKVLPG